MSFAYSTIKIALKICSKNLVYRKTFRLSSFSIYKNFYPTTTIASLNFAIQLINSQIVLNIVVLSTVMCLKLSFEVFLVKFN